MTDKAWVEGMALLLALGLPGWPTEPKESDLRSGTMRPLLDDLDDAAWLYGCRQAAQREKWFPVVATLREYADEYQPPAAEHRYLPRYEGNGWDDMETARKGLAMIRQAVLERTGVDLAEPVKSVPK